VGCSTPTAGGTGVCSTGSQIPEFIVLDDDEEE
jgi:hypothetical protein